MAFNCYLRHYIKGSNNYDPGPGVPNHGEVIREYGAASYALNMTLNALMFDALEIPAAARTTLGTDPFMVEWCRLTRFKST